MGARKKHGRTFEGDFLVGGKRFAIVVSRFNEYITRHMLTSCENVLARHGVKPESIDVVWVPGSFEIPVAAKKIAEKRSADAVICIGCIIRGDTPHFDHISRETSKGIMEIGRRTGVPTIFGILTCETIQQAIERAGTKMGNKGGEAALTALEMASLMDKL